MDILTYSFFQHALLGVLMISVMSAMVGTYIVTRHMVFISGGITHACFGGLGLGYYLGTSPLLMASVFAVAGALGVDRLARGRVRRDSAIAVIWALGMAIGVLFIFLTSGYVPELNTFLFGNVLTVTKIDLWLYFVLSVATGAFYLVFRRIIVMLSFDADFARVRHLPVTFVETVMTVIVALAIVLTIRMIGIMLLISVFTLPQIIAEGFTRRYGRMMLLSGVASTLCCVGGLFLSYVISVPASAAIVLLMTAAFMACSAIHAVRRRLALRRA